MRTSHLILLILSIVCGIPVILCSGCFMLAALKVSSLPPPRPTQPKPIATRATTPEQKEALGKILGTLLSQKVVHRLDSRYCYVLPDWYTLTIDVKPEYAAYAWMCANNCVSANGAIGSDIGNRRLIFRDAITGKRLGTFCPDHGLDLD